MDRITTGPGTEGEAMTDPNKPLEEMTLSELKEARELDRIALGVYRDHLAETNEKIAEELRRLGEP